eukprot:88555-Heterocapsa_arctica.AAC.1
MMIDILDLESNALLPILSCPKFLLVPEQMENDLEVAREHLRMEGELEFARTMMRRAYVELKMNPDLMRTEMDMRAWAWAADMVMADEAGEPGPGSIDLALGVTAVDDQGYDEPSTWGDAAIRPILDNLGPDWGPVSVGNDACVYHEIFDDEHMNALTTVIEGIEKYYAGDELLAIDNEGVIRHRDETIRPRDDSRDETPL